MSSDGKSGLPYSRYRSWDDLPPKRRRLFGWLIVWWLLGSLVSIPFKLVGLSGVVVAVIVVALFAAMMIPAGWAAWQELQQRRADGEESPPPQVKGGSVIGWASATATFWGLYGAVLPYAEGPAIPAVPLWVSVVAVLKFRRWRQQKVRASAGEP